MECVVSDDAPSNSHPNPCPGTPRDHSASSAASADILVPPPGHRMEDASPAPLTNGAHLTGQCTAAIICQTGMPLREHSEIIMTTITLRHYVRPADFRTVGDFLIRHYQPGNRDGNWLQPIWQYMHSHPNLDEAALERIGVWEGAGEIVAVVHYESTLGEAFFELHPDYAFLKRDMLDYAEEHLFGISAAGQRYVRAYVNDFDGEVQALVSARGYERVPDEHRPQSSLRIPSPFPEITLPTGFMLKSLAEDNDLRKIDRALWRGFNHPGEPPEDSIEGRRKMQSVPNFRKDLNIVAEAPDGHFVAYAGTWFEPVNRYAYVEPVATDPDFRRLGLGKAAVLEGIRRCAELGATVAYVGSAQLFYRSMGFAPDHVSQCWARHFEA